MTKEQEEKTIKYLEVLRKEYLEDAKRRKENGEITRYGTMEDIDKLRALYIGFALDMLKEKDKKINSKNGAINALQCALKERTEERDRKDNIMARQRKQIDLIINFIYEIWCKYHGSISHELRLNGFNDDECGTCENTDKNCVKCIKQYFERKSEE